MTKLSLYLFCALVLSPSALAQEPSWFDPNPLAIKPLHVLPDVQQPDAPKHRMSPAARMRLLPPVEYDYPYTGNLHLSRSKRPDEVRAACPTAKFLATPAACAQATLNRSQCWVYMLEDDGLIALGYDVDIVFRHEMGHCNGWAHNR